MACAAAPTPPLPVHATPPAPPPAPPPSPDAPSVWGCTELPLPDGIHRPLSLTNEQSRLLGEAERILAEPSVHGHAAWRAFTQARALLDAKRWPEATSAFGEIARTYSHEDLGILSAMLYVEGINLLGSQLEPPRPGCHDEMSARLPTLQRLYCENGENQRHPQECRLFFRIERSLQRGVGCGIPSQPGMQKSPHVEELERRWK